MHKWLLTFLIGNLWSVAIYSQVQLQRNGQKVEISRAGIQYLFTDTMPYTTEAAEDLLTKDWLPFSEAVRISYQPNILLLKIPLPMIADTGSYDLLAVENPHLNKLKIWTIRKGKFINSYPLTGDHYRFSSRTLPATHFVFPLIKPGTQADTLLLAVDKRSSKMDIPLHFYQEKYFYASQSKSYLVKGLICGLLLLLIFFNCLLFLSSTEAVYVWYGLYLLAILIYFTADSGLLFQFVYPSQPQINDLARPFAFASSLFPMLLFFNSLLNIREHAPRLYQINKGILFLYLCIFLIALFSSISGDHLHHGLWLRVNAVVSPVILLVVLLESAILVRKGVRFAWFAFLSFLIFTLAITIYALGQNKLLPETRVVLNAQYLGIFVDCCIVAWSLAWRYYSFRNDARRLRSEYKQQQKQIFSESMNWQKEEMQRFSSLLHDNVGAHLGFLRLKVDKMKLSEAGKKEIADMVSALGDEVRHMSHQFSPLQLQDKGLYAAVEEMVEQTRTGSSIALQFEWLGNRQSLDVQYELVVYRILQELFQNLLKHAQATEAILQIMHEEYLFGIYLEDNGIGSANMGEPQTGIGLRSIEQLVKQLKGRFAIATAPKKGFSISIEFPIIT